LKLFVILYKSVVRSHLEYVNGLVMMNKLVQHHCQYDLRKYSFINRVIPIWTSLSNSVVCAKTVNILKNRVDIG